jgi:hypothetical protein
MAAVLLYGNRRRAVIGALSARPLLLEGDDVSLLGATNALQALSGLDEVQRRMQLVVLSRALAKARA